MAHAERLQRVPHDAREHEHVQQAHAASRPDLQCSLPADNLRGAAAVVAAARAPRGAHRRWVYRYAKGTLVAFRDYYADTGRFNSSSCSLIEDVHLRKRDPWVEWPPPVAKPRTPGPRANRRRAGRPGWERGRS